MKKMGKKGFALNDLPNVAMTFLLIGVFFAVALVVLAGLAANSQVGSGTTSGTANYAIQKTITAVSEIPNNWLLLIAVIVAAAVIIGIVMSSLGREVGR